MQSKCDVKSGLLGKRSDAARYALISSTIHLIKLAYQNKPLNLYFISENPYADTYTYSAHEVISVICMQMQ
jgi:hypothetical protein